MKEYYQVGNQIVATNMDDLVVSFKIDLAISHHTNITLFAGAEPMAWLVKHASILLQDCLSDPPFSLDYYACSKLNVDAAFSFLEGSNAGCAK